MINKILSFDNLTKTKIKVKEKNIYFNQIGSKCKDMLTYC